MAEGTRIVDAVVENRIASYHEGREILQSQSFVQAASYDDPILAGTVISLDGPDHLTRRRLENPLFGSEPVGRYVEIVDATVQEELATASEELRTAGAVDLVRMLKRVMIRFAASMAGISIMPEEAQALLEHVERMTEGILAVQFSSDPSWQEILDDGVEAKTAFRTQFYEPSRAACPAHAEESSVPASLLQCLLSIRPQWSDEAVLREVAFYLMAATHTMTQSVISTLLELDEWLESYPDRMSDLHNREFIDRATHEALRLRPPDPGLLRRATADVVLSTGREIREGETAYIDIAVANRDPVAFGEDAELFDPDRRVPPTVQPYGLTFGAGPHMCIGQRLASGRGKGVRTDRPEPDGIVTRVVAALLAARVKFLPGEKPYWKVNSMQATAEQYRVTFDPN